MSQYYAEPNILSGQISGAGNSLQANRETEVQRQLIRLDVATKAVAKAADFLISRVDPALRNEPEGPRVDQKETERAPSTKLGMALAEQAMLLDSIYQRLRGAGDRIEL